MFADLSGKYDSLPQVLNAMSAAGVDFRASPAAAAAIDQAMEPVGRSLSRRNKGGAWNAIAQPLDNFIAGRNLRQDAQLSDTQLAGLRPEDLAIRDMGGLGAVSPFMENQYVAVEGSAPNADFNDLGVAVGDDQSAFLAALIDADRRRRKLEYDASQSP